MLAEGTTSLTKTCAPGDTKNATGNGSVTGIGRTAAAAIWYRAIRDYMTSSTTYPGARTATLQAARRRFEAALAADPDYAPARLSLGTVLFELGQLAEAEPVLEGVVEALGLLRDQENLVGGLVLLARLFELTDRSAEAYRRLSMALRHDPDNLEIRAAMAKNRHAAGRWRDTLAAIDPIEQRLAAGNAAPSTARRQRRACVLGQRREPRHLAEQFDETVAVG